MKNPNAKQPSLLKKEMIMKILVYLITLIVMVYVLMGLATGCWSWG